MEIKSSCCGGSKTVDKTYEAGGSVSEWHEAGGRKIPAVSTKLAFGDIAGMLKVRLAIGRNDYRVKPGLYRVGSPASDSPVLVTANYKLTFDILRSEIEGLSAWILVLDTKGINVWCAAGKGTFGTNELIGKINETGLSEIVEHRRIILPQLGAVGVAAHLVKNATGFNVSYGPVRAADVKRYIAGGYKKDDEMRRVNFNMRDRLTVIPVELVMAWRFIAAIAAFFVFINAFAGRKLFLRSFMRDLIPAVGGAMAGIAAVPALLPYIPGRAFSVKGFIAGAAWLALAGCRFGFNFSEWIANFFVITPLASFFALNFTGATTFTSQSGTEYEVKKTFNPMKYSLIFGAALKVIFKFLK